MPEPGAAEHYIFLEDDLELSPSFFTWAKSAGEAYFGSAIGVSLYRPRWDEINWRSFAVSGWVLCLVCIGGGDGDDDRRLLLCSL